MSHRRAWFPRLWPVLVPSCLVVGAVAFLIDLTTVEAIAFGLIVGSVVMNARLWIWRRRHPVITPVGYLDDMRRRARWN